MSNQIDVSKSFQEKVFNRIRDSIGELMTDEELRALLDATIQKSFFEPRKVRDPNRSSYHSEYTIEKEPWMVEMIRDLMKDRMTEALKVWLKEHEAEVVQLIQDSINKGFMGCLVSAIDSKMLNGMMQLKSEMMNQLSTRS